MPDQSTPEELFWAKVDKNGPIQDHCPEIGHCWLWTGPRWPNGYGLVDSSIADRRRCWGAHVVAYVLTNGFSSDEPCVLHRCDNPPCVRPDHLFAGTKQTNTFDAMQKGRHYAVSPACELGDRARAMADKVFAGWSINKVAAYYRVPQSHVNWAIEAVQREQSGPVVRTKAG